MRVIEQPAKSILRKHRRVDSWFGSRYGMNLYRGCAHNCAYCDGRDEKYRVTGEFGREVVVKTNAPDLLNRELDPARKRTPMRGGYVMLGGGVGDCYQPVEEQYQLARQTLLLLEKYRHPVHILTKSTLVERDREIIQRIHQQSGAIVSFSFSSVDDGLSRVVEPGVPPPSRRLETIWKFKSEGIPCGMYLMPVIPFVSDTPAHIEAAVRMAKESGIDFMVFCGMTLKEGRQKDHFLALLHRHFPHLIQEYNFLYPKDPHGQARTEYYRQVNELFLALARKHRMPPRLPASLLKNILEPSDLTQVILEQMDYVLKSIGRRSPYGYAAWSLCKAGKPVGELRHQLGTLPGVGPVTEKIIREILNTGTCQYYRKLVNQA